jgi:N-acetylneuraminic acid mutarotase
VAFPLPHRSSFGHAVVGDTLYIVGGHGGQAHSYLKQRFSASCHAVSLATGSATEIDPFPFGVQGNRLVEHNGEIYCFGGFRYEPGLDIGEGKNPPFDWYARSSNEVWAYSTYARHWRYVTNLPRPRSSNVAGKIGDRAYLVGGWDGTPWHREDFYGRYHTTVEVFDFNARAFLPGGVTIPEPRRRAFTGAVAGGKLWMVCGLGVSSPEGDPEGAKLDEFTSFDPAAGWKTSSAGELPAFPVGLFSPGMCVLSDGTFVVTGGTDKNRKYNQQVWRWKPGWSGWVRNSKPLPAEVSFPELIPVDRRRVLVIGGHQRKDPAGLWELIDIDENET